MVLGVNNLKGGEYGEIDDRCKSIVRDERYIYLYVPFGRL
jgi:hypothetical protein